jgi:hypothetical protein
LPDMACGVGANHGEGKSEMRAGQGDSARSG